MFLVRASGAGASDKATRGDEVDLHPPSEVTGKRLALEPVQRPQEVNTPRGEAGGRKHP